MHSLTYLSTFWTNACSFQVGILTFQHTKKKPLFTAQVIFLSKQSLLKVSSLYLKGWIRECDG